MSEEPTSTDRDDLPPRVLRGGRCTRLSSVAPGPPRASAPGIATAPSESPRRPPSALRLIQSASTHDGAVDEPDPAARPRRRTFAAEYKARMVAEYDGCRSAERARRVAAPGGLYSSHMAEWRKARDAGACAGSARGQAAAFCRSRWSWSGCAGATERLESELARTTLALEIMGKAHALLELLSESADSDPKSKP